MKPANKYKPYTTQEDEYIKAHISEGFTVVAEALGRTRRAISQRALTLNARQRFKKFKPTTDEIRLIKAEYRRQRVAFLAAMLGISPYTLYRFARKLGLRKRRRKGDVAPPGELKLRLNKRIVKYRD